MTESQLHLHSTADQSEFLSQHCPNLHKIFTTHPYINGFIFITVVTFDLAELINDWLLYKDLVTIELGLVYGPLNSKMTVLLLMSCIIGTLLFSFEILNLLRDMMKGRPWVDQDLISALIIWIDQIPMLIINIIISLCHDELVSYFQLIKVLLICIAVILRAVNPLLRNYVNKNKYSGNERVRNYVYRIVTTVGICFLLVGCVMLFIFSHLIGPDQQKFKPRLPKETWTGNSLQEKYFTDVGIYIQVFSTKGFTRRGQEYWIKLVDILDCYRHNPLYVKLALLQGQNVLQKLVISRFDSNKMYAHKCYSLNLTKKTAKPTYTDCGSQSNSEDFSLKIMFKFVLIRPQKQLILGDIRYNAAVLADGKCQRIWENTTGTYAGSSPVDAKFVGKLLYKKLEEEEGVVSSSIATNRDITVIAEGKSTTGQFLTDAITFWTTGLLGCKCRGKAGPTLDPSSQVTC